MSDGALWAVVTALAGAVSTLAGLLLREVRDRLADCEAEVQELKTQARATTDAKNQELAEWKQRALAAETRRERT